MIDRVLALDEQIQAVPAEKRTTKVSLAVLLHDDFAPEGQPIGRTQVSLKELQQQAIRNLSGYYFFTDVDDGTYTVQITSDYYFDREEEVVLPLPDPREPLLIVNCEDYVTLRPKPFYPFPPGATLIKGVVKDIQGQPVPGAAVEIQEKGLQTQTTEKGEFVFYFTGLTKEDIIVEDKKRFVKANGGQTLMTVEATHDSLNGNVQTRVEECRTTSVFITIQSE